MDRQQWCLRRNASRHGGKAIGGDAMADVQAGWTEADSRRYRELAAVAVPARDEQMAALLALLPFRQDESFRAVELGCGEGYLSAALLECFPHALVVALDGSAEMRAIASDRVRRFGARAHIDAFDLADTDWLQRFPACDCVLSSLCLHHLPGDAKRRLFAAISQQLSPRGALLIADLVAPQRREAWDLYAATWDRLAQAQSMSKTGSPHLFEKFVKERWNHYRFPDPVDQPSPLFEQLSWLQEAGFAVVDCFWLQGGHAIYGGYKSRAGADSPGVPFPEALRLIQRTLAAGESRSEGFTAE
jgi:tRNA (cmo5U34)-methyltransferase